MIALRAFVTKVMTIGVVALVAILIVLAIISSIKSSLGFDNPLGSLGDLNESAEGIADNPYEVGEFVGDKVTGVLPAAEIKEHRIDVDVTSIAQSEIQWMNSIGLASREYTIGEASKHYFIEVPVIVFPFPIPIPGWDYESGKTFYLRDYTYRASATVPGVQGISIDDRGSSGQVVTVSYSAPTWSGDLERVYDNKYDEVQSSEDAETEEDFFFAVNEILGEEVSITSAQVELNNYVVGLVDQDLELFETASCAAGDTVEQLLTPVFTEMGFEVVDGSPDSINQIQIVAEFDTPTQILSSSDLNADSCQALLDGAEFNDGSFTNVGYYEPDKVLEEVTITDN